MKQLAIPLSNLKTVAKWLVISQQAGKSLVIMANGLIQHFHGVMGVAIRPKRLRYSHQTELLAVEPA